MDLDFTPDSTKWRSRLLTTKGRQLTGIPAYWPTKIPDLLDFLIDLGKEAISTNYILIILIYDLSSDHTAVLITISATVIQVIIKESIKDQTGAHFRNTVHT